MIRLKQVHKRFGGVQAVRGIDLAIEPGEVVGILGPNGAGKSTTVRMIAAAIPPSSGAVEVGGFDAVARSLDVRRRMGYMPEAAPLYREMRVRDLLRYRAGLFGLTGRRRSEAVDRAAAQCQLSDVMRRRCGELSKGYRQRTGLASVLLHDPDVLILDEPTSGLDPAQIAETRTLIRGLAGKRTMLIVSHILPEVERSCSRIVVFAGGRIRADGAPADLLRRFRPAGLFTLEWRGEGALEHALRELKGVRSISSGALETGWHRSTIESEPGAGDLRESIARAAASASCLVRELHAQQATLEDVYLSLVSHDGLPAGGAPP